MAATASATAATAASAAAALHGVWRGDVADHTVTIFLDHHHLSKGAACAASASSAAPTAPLAIALSLGRGGLSGRRGRAAAPAVAAAVAAAAAGWRSRWAVQAVRRDAQAARLAPQAAVEHAGGHL